MCFDDYNWVEMTRFGLDFLGSSALTRPPVSPAPHTPHAVIAGPPP